MRVRALVAVIISMAIVIGMAGVASAVPPTLSRFTQTYPPAASSKLNDCIVCHAQVPSLNPYGTDLLAAAYNFAAVESKDSDGDGFTNVQEITALTFPGDPADAPAGASSPPAVSSSDSRASASSTPTGLMHVDDFSDATNFGDPDWEVLAGSWSTAGSARAFESGAKGKSIAILNGNPPIKNMDIGTIEARGKLLGRSSKLTVIFDFRDTKHFRFVRLERGRIVMGQVGKFGETKPGVKFLQKASVPLNKFHRIRIGVLGKGRVSVSIANSEGKDLVKPFGMSFSAASPGKIGLLADSKVQVDSFKVWKKVTED